MLSARASRWAPPSGQALTRRRAHHGMAQFAAMAIQFGEGVDAAEDCMKSSLAITAKGSLDLGDIRLGLQVALPGAVCR